MPVHITVTRTSEESEALYQLGAITLTDQAWAHLEQLLHRLVLFGAPKGCECNVAADQRPEAFHYDRCSNKRCRCGHRIETHASIEGGGCRYADSEGLCLCARFEERT